MEVKSTKNTQPDIDEIRSGAILSPRGDFDTVSRSNSVPTRNTVYNMYETRREATAKAPFGYGTAIVSSAIEKIQK